MGDPAACVKEVLEAVAVGLGFGGQQAIVAAVFKKK